MAPVSIDNAKCVLVIGATSGIGRALALAISSLPSHPTVIAAGRRQDRLKELQEKNLETLQIDVTADLGSLKQTVESLIVKYPNLDAVILSSGIQYMHDFKKDVDISQVIREINVNYLAVVSLISLFIPHFLKLSAEGRPSFIIPITSGLGLLPSPLVINYSASKAALRSFTTSLRKQLEDTKVNVLEIIPPLVESELHDEQGTTERLSKFWMPLDEYTKLTVDGLRKGDIHIAAGRAAEVLEKFEKGGLNGLF
ncbi:hypothetical protein DFH08DRAFT_473503 [Mycena albidolilacea]|uniref:NAD(P)-binding protein n=1 Tax=Mycena albidolilacea TaxID=1033008 RepID=A0AAD7AFC7_9AGAR|nr:hypothetical protein DFH08DRAFT_473503 [Mycena albidolilacea]